MTSAIMNPLHQEEMQGVMGADVLLAKDPNCRRWIARFREPHARGCGAAARGERGERRRRARRGGMSGEALVVFTPSGKRGRFPVGTPLLTAARKLGVDIDSVCGGRAHLRPLPGRGRRGRVRQARHRLGAEPSDARSRAVEERYAAHRRASRRGRRLSCQARLQGDLVVDVPPESQVHRQVVRKRAEAAPIELDPVVRLYYVEVDEPDMHKPRGDFERLRRGARRAMGPARTSRIDLRPLPVAAEDAARRRLEGHRRGPRRAARSSALWPGFHERAYGLAVDIGSTTIAAHLCDLASGEVVASAGMMNPQIRFGEDLMSRVSYVMMNPGGDKELTRGRARGDRRA